MRPGTRVVNRRVLRKVSDKNVAKILLRSQLWVKNQHTESTKPIAKPIIDATVTSPAIGRTNFLLMIEFSPGFKP